MEYFTADLPDGLDPESILDILHRSRPAWHADAACHEAPLDVSWFDPYPEAEEDAKEICRRCLVMNECRSWAFSQGPTLEGVWGGLSRSDRSQYRRRGLTNIPIVPSEIMGWSA